MAQARQEGINRIRPQMVPGPSPDSEEVTSTPHTPLSEASAPSQSGYTASHEAVFQSRKSVLQNQNMKNQAKEQGMTEAEFNAAHSELSKAYHGEGGQKAISQEEYDRRWAELRKEFNGGYPPGITVEEADRRWAQAQAERDRRWAELRERRTGAGKDRRAGEQSAPYGAAAILKQENSMSDEAGRGEQNGEHKDLSSKERAFLAQVYQRDVVAKALKAGKLACLPGKDGRADTKPAVNLANGTHYHGANLLQLKDFQRNHGFPSAEYVTQDALEKSGIPLREGERGVDINFSVKDKETGEWEHRTAKLFNVAQSEKPEELKNWAAAQVEEKIREHQDFLKNRLGESYKPPVQSAREPGPDITCTSTEPAKYLGQYLAAASMGSAFKASPEQAAEFSKKFEGALSEKMENGYSNPFKLSALCNAANEYCKTVITEVRQEQRMEQTRQHSQGRSL
jgi:hypothetical protein